ncbi:FecR family protein [Mangrovibacterium lignilyticum]|uniref:FecR family protein n=1 Tax=Mangrovibacterium lignilyticum TaxID=2668052 RepID=UPI0013CF678E|nr:FecR domain-containing protein [Mangrovibacterium lignilyticum]
MENKIPLSIIMQHIASGGKEYSGEAKTWVEESEANKKTFDDLSLIWKLTGKFPERYTPNKDLAWSKIKGRIKQPKPKFNLYRRVAQIAAAVLVAALCVWSGAEFKDAFNQPRYTEVISLAGQKTKVMLPDSSVVQLNGNSQLRYSSDFSKADREVELKGEAYFDVTKDKHHRFVVHAGDLDVKVYGTSFNVKAYDTDALIEVGLKHGSVALEKNNSEVLRLVPGQLAKYDAAKDKVNVSEVDIDLVSAWTRNEMIIEELPLQEIILYLERWYGVQIKASPELLDGELFTFKVKTESLHEVIEMLSVLKPIKYNIDGELVTLSNK